MHDFPGTRLILMTLLKTGRSPDDKRTLEERYNIIMEAIFGKKAKQHFIKKPVGGQKKNIKKWIPYELVLLGMYLEEQKSGDTSRYQLAKKFIKFIRYNADDKSAILRLSNDYKKAKIRLEDVGYRNIIRYYCTKPDPRGNFDDLDLLHEIFVKEALENVGWYFDERELEFDPEQLKWLEEE